MQAPKPQDFLLQMVERYAAMDSYSDTGVVRQRLDMVEPPFEIAFSTAFKKPWLFRFEFATPHPYPPLRHNITKHVVGFDGTTAYFATNEPEAESFDVEVEDDISLAVAGATGISGGAAHTIARLLLPDIGGLSVLDLVGVQLKADVVFDGCVCSVIAAQHPRDRRPLELWIEKDTVLLRKLITGDGSTEEVRQGIQVNAPPDAALFQAPPDDR